jgi:hypothetical protein
VIGHVADMDCSQTEIQSALKFAVSRFAPGSVHVGFAVDKMAL